MRHCIQGYRSISNSSLWVFFHSSTEGPETTRKLIVEMTANPVILVTLFSPLFLAKLWQLFAKIANKREVDTTCAFTHCVSKRSEACPQCQKYGLYYIPKSMESIGIDFVGHFWIRDLIVRTPDLTKPRLDLEPCSCKDCTPKTLLNLTLKKEFPQLKVALRMPLHF